MATQILSIPSNEYVQAVDDKINFLIEPVSGSQVMAIFSDTKPSAGDLGHLITPDRPLPRIGIAGKVWLKGKGVNGGTATVIVSAGE